MYSVGYEGNNFNPWHISLAYNLKYPEFLKRNSKYGFLDTFVAPNENLNEGHRTSSPPHDSVHICLLALVIGGRGCAPAESGSHEFSLIASKSHQGIMKLRPVPGCGLGNITRIVYISWSANLRPSQVPPLPSFLLTWMLT